MINKIKEGLLFIKSKISDISSFIEALPNPYPENFAGFKNLLAFKPKPGLKKFIGTYSILIILGLILSSLFILSPKFIGFSILENLNSDSNSASVILAPTGANINPQPTNPSAQTQNIYFPVNEESSANFAGLISILSNSQIIKDFPDKVIVSLRIYSYSNGGRTLQKEYTLKKANVIEGATENPDIIMNLPSYYVNSFYNQDFCTILKSAKSNQDLSFETKLSDITLAWKFKSMLRYKDCIA